MSVVSASYTVCDLSDGVATHFLNTTYSGTQATLENWGSTGGASWSFSHITSDYSDVKVGDSCWMRCTNVTKNGYTYVGMVVASISSTALVAASGLGIIDKGDTGDDAISYWLEKSATIISKDTNNSNVLTPSSVTVTAKKNVGGTTSDFTTGTIKLYANGTEISPASSTSSSITFNPSASVSTYVIKLFSGSIELDAESIPIIATGKNGTNGVNAIIAVLTNDSAQVPTDSSGNNPDFTTATTTIEIYEGGNKVTPTSYGPHVCSNCTVNATNAASVTVTGMSANSATVTLKAAYGGKTYSKVFTISKQKQGIQGNAGADGDSPTAYPQYALVYTGATPGTNDWEDERPSNWAVGYSYWTRTKYVYSPTRTEYSEAIEDTTYNQYMQSQTYLRIVTDKTSYNKNLRNNQQFTITFNASVSGYENPSVSWTIVSTLGNESSQTSQTGYSVTLSYAQTQAPDSITVTCNLSSVVNNTTYTSTASTTIYVNDVTVYDLNFGIQETVPTGTYVNGDSYALKTTTGGVENFIPYVFVNGQWTEVTESTISRYPGQMAQIRNAVLAEGINVPSSSQAIYAYFKFASIQHAQIDALSSSEIVLTRASDGSSGIIRSSNYDEDADKNPISGFKIDYDGNSAFVKSNMVDATVSGSFTSDGLSTQDELVSSEITGTFESTPSYNDGDTAALIKARIGENQLANISGTYGSTAFSKVLVLRNDSQRTELKLIASKSNISGNDSISGTIPVNTSSLTITAQRYRRSINKFVYSDTKEAVCYYKRGSETRQSFSGNSITLSGSYNQSLLIEHEYPYSENVTVGSYDVMTSIDNPDPSASKRFKFNNDSKRCSIIDVNDVLFCITSDDDTHIYRKEPNSDWTKIAVIASAASDYMFEYGSFCVGNSKIIIYSWKCIYTSDLNGISWTKTFESSDNTTIFASEQMWFGNGEFRIPVGNTNNHGYYRSYDGITWTFVSDSNFRYCCCYGNGVWVSEGHLPLTGINGNLTFCNGKFFFLYNYHSDSSNRHCHLYMSTNGRNWTLVKNFTDSSYAYRCTKVIYANGYYYIQIYPNDVSASVIGTYVSTDGTTWTRMSKTTFEGCGGANYAGGRIFFTPVYGIDFASYTSADWKTEQTGSLSASYSFDQFPIGANLIDSSGNIVKTLSEDYSVWHTSQISIPAYSSYSAYNEAAYKKFLGFSKASFDGRKYDTTKTFALVATNHSGVSINITSPSSQGHEYNLKWNGNVFQVNLNGVTLYTFYINDYFQSTPNFRFTPFGQLAAILTKDILPKADSTHTIGASGNEFLAGYINTVYGNLEGDVIGNVRGDVTGNVSGSSGSCTGNAATATVASSCSGNAATASSCTGNSATASYASYATFIGEGTCNLYSHYSNEINFGGSSTATDMYFGYRSIDGRPVPSAYHFGTSSNATIYAGAVYGAVFN